MMITNNFDRMAIWQTKPMYWEPKLALFSVSQTLKKRCCFFRITVFTINVSSVYTQQGTEDFLRTFWNKATEYLILLSYGVFYSDLWCLIEPLDLKNVYHYRAVMCFRESCGSDSLSILVPWVISKMTSFFFLLGTPDVQNLFLSLHIYTTTVMLWTGQNHTISQYKWLIKLY